MNNLEKSLVVEYYGIRFQISEQGSKAMNRGRQHLFLVLVWFTARLPGFEFATEDVFELLQEVRAVKRPACTAGDALFYQ